MKTKILVSGCSGFIGGALCAKLLERADVEIVGVDNMNNYYDVRLKEFRLSKLMKKQHFHFVKVSIADKDEVGRIFTEYRPDCVVNLAAQAGVRYSLENPDAYIESNVVGFYNILEACKTHSVKHLIYASSSSVYGDGAKIPYSTEDKCDRPVSLYAATKRSDELLAYAYSSLYKIPMTGLRFFTVYGPAGRPDMAYFDFTKKLLGGETLKIFNYGKCERDFTYIDDIVEGVEKVIDHAPEGETLHKVYNIGHGSPVKLLEFIKILQEELVRAHLLPEDFNFRKHAELVDAAPGDVGITFADTSAFEQEFKYRPQTDFRDGIREFVGWYKDYYNVPEVR